MRRGRLVYLATEDIYFTSHRLPNGDLRRRFGEASRKLVEENYSADRIGVQITALYGRFGGTVQPVLSQAKARGTDV